MAKFSKYGGKVSFVVDGQTLDLKRVKTEKIQELMNFVQDDKTVLINTVEFFVKLIYKNYPEENEEEILGFVQTNAMKITEEFQIAYGLISREELEKAKRNALDDINGKIK